jgi:hypothetical protein
MERYEAIIISAVSGLAAGIVGSLIAPWVKWAVDRRREKLSYRRSIVESARNKIDASIFNKHQITSSLEWRYLEKYMPINVIDSFKMENHFLCGEPNEDASNPYRRELAKALEKLEHDWGLT